MKNTNNIILLAMMAMWLVSCNAKGPNLQLSEYTHHFIIKDKNSPYNGTVTISNCGDADLIIENISTGCGCTNAVVDKETIKPKDSALLQFTYNPRGKSGHQEEYIVIQANTDSIVHLLCISTYIE